MEPDHFYLQRWNGGSKRATKDVDNEFPVKPTKIKAVERTMGFKISSEKCEVRILQTTWSLIVCVRTKYKGFQYYHVDLLREYSACLDLINFPASEYLDDLKHHVKRLRHKFCDLVEETATAESEIGGLKFNRNEGLSTKVCKSNVSIKNSHIARVDKVTDIIIKLQLPIELRGDTKIVGEHVTLRTPLTLKKFVEHIKPIIELFFEFPRPSGDKKGRGGKKKDNSGHDHDRHDLTGNSPSSDMPNISPVLSNISLADTAIELDINIDSSNSKESKCMKKVLHYFANHYFKLNEGFGLLVIRCFYISAKSGWRSWNDFDGLTEIERSAVAIVIITFLSRPDARRYVKGEKDFNLIKEILDKLNPLTSDDST